MNKPEVRIVDYQSTSEPVQMNVSSGEAYALMAKYGINPTQAPTQFQPQFVDTNQDLTFDQLIAIEEQKIRAERQRKEYERLQELNKPTPYSFDRNKVQYHNNDYRSIEDTEFGIEVKVVSDMPINKGYGY
jgi:hypothetical protein